MQFRAIACWGLLSLVGCQAVDPTGDDADFPDGPRLLADKEDLAKKIPYKGGAVLHRPLEVHLYWGEYWRGAVGQKERGVLDGFAGRAGGSSWYGILDEYPDRQGGPGRSRAGASVVVADSEPGDRISDRAVRRFVEQRVQDGTVAWSDQAVYFVFTPPGTVTTTPWGATCDAICGYHYKFKSTVAGSGLVKYALIPYGECADGCLPRGLHANGAALDQMTVVLSHELAEAVTDPEITAWTGPRGDPEVADVCDGGFVADWGGARFAVQALWSNASLSCVEE